MNDYKSMYHYVLGRSEDMADTLNATTQILDIAVKSFMDISKKNEELYLGLIENFKNKEEINLKALEKIKKLSTELVSDLLENNLLSEDKIKIH